MKKINATIELEEQDYLAMISLARMNGRPVFEEIELAVKNWLNDDYK